MVVGPLLDLGKPRICRKISLVGTLKAEGSKFRVNR